jgi:multiple sugar transport system substrate-binding protein
MTGRKRNLKFASMVAIGLASALTLIGCSPSPSNPGETTISFWQYYGLRSDELHGKPLYELIDRFMEANPDIKVDVHFVTSPDFNRTILQSAASKTLPTVMLIDSNDTALYAHSGLARDVTDLATTWGQQASYYPAAWETTQVDDKTYGLPAIGDTYGLYYNKDLLEKAGITPPTTWDELTADAKKLSGDGHYGLAFGGKTGAVDGIYPTLMRYLAESTDVTHVDNAAGRTALANLKDLVDSGAVSNGVTTWTEDDVYTQFTTGAAAMMINSAGYVTGMSKDFPDLHWDVVPMPSGSQQGLTYLQSENLVMSPTANDAEVQAAWKLLTFMQQPDQLKTYLPARSKLSLRTDVELENPVTKKFSSFLANAWVPTGEAREKWAAVSATYQVAFESVISGSSSVDDALTAFQQSIDTALGG